jgi:Flavin-binding monooxygenase-like
MTGVLDRREHYCIIGAGSSGLVGARHLLATGIPVDIYEKTDEVGGNWNYGSASARVFRTTHLVSSKRMTEYPDFPMPDHFPHFPGHRQAQAYLRAYADHFQVVEHIRFNTSVERVVREADDTWLVTLDTGETLRYGGVIIANGHNWSPRWPSYPGQFDGELMHANDYRTSDVLRGRRVVVVGGGNSGCDIICEAAQVGELAVHSLRRGYHIVPKYLFGLPADVMQEIFMRARIPVALQRVVGGIWLKMFSHELWRFGYPRPDHKLWETHLVLNDPIVFHASHGDITPKPDIARFDGSDVVFTDGTSVRADLVVFATGYRLQMPFLDAAELDWSSDAGPGLYLNMFSPRHDNLFVLGLMQPSGGQWQLVDYQSRALAAFVWAQRNRPERAEWLRGLKRQPPPSLSGQISYVKSPRHTFEVEHTSYRRSLNRIIWKLTGKRTRALPPLRRRVGAVPGLPATVGPTPRAAEVPAGSA